MRRSASCMSRCIVSQNFFTYPIDDQIFQRSDRVYYLTIFCICRGSQYDQIQKPPEFSQADPHHYQYVDNSTHRDEPPSVDACLLCLLARGEKCKSISTIRHASRQTE